MKKQLFTLLLAVVASIGTTFAHDVEIGGIYYNLNNDELTATVTHYGDPDIITMYPSSYNSHKYSGNMTIPENITHNSKNYSVVGIGADAFYQCKGLTSITFPNSLTYISTYAFSGCSALTEVVLPDNITSIYQGAFSACSALESVTLPKNLNFVGNAAFTGCGELKEVHISDIKSFCEINYIMSSSYQDDNTPNPLYYAKHLFLNDEEVTELVIPEGTTKVSKYAFINCASLTSVQIPTSVITIGYNAFKNCENISSVEIMSGDTIEAYAFYNCHAMKKITLSNTTKTIGAYAFANCSALQDIILPNTITQIGQSTFSSCENLKQISIPNNITSLPTSIFNGCKKMETVVLPETLTNIGGSAFYNCSMLRSIEIPNSVEIIEGSAFANCIRLFISIPEHVEIEGGWGTFDYVPNIVYNHIDDEEDENTTYGAKSRNGYVDGYLVYTDATKTELCACSADMSGTVTIPSSVSKISDIAFAKCDQVNEVDIPNSVSYIGGSAFKECVNLTKVTLPNSLTRISNALFMDCTRLSSITIPNSVNKIESNAFYGCRSLTSLYVSPTIKEIEAYAFSDVPNIIYTGTLDGALWGALHMNHYADDILVYEDATKIKITACAASANGILQIPNTVLSIGEKAFYKCADLTTIEFPNSLTSLDATAIQYCNNLKYLTFDNLNLDIPLPQSTFALFNGCPNLSLLFTLTTPPTWLNNHQLTNSINAIYVPNGSLDVYENAVNWYYSSNTKPIKEMYQFQVDTYSTSSTLNVGNAADFIPKIIEWRLSDDNIIYNGEEPIEFIGLEPNSEYRNIPVVLTSSTGETRTVTLSFNTSALDLSTQPARLTSNSSAILVAETNMADIETNCGFEFRRTAASDAVPSQKMTCPVANGTMAVKVKNLYAGTEYKYRPYYTSTAGNTYYGDWSAFDPQDAYIEYEPVVYTYPASAVTDTSAVLKGYALEGSQDITEQGIELWADSRVEGTQSNSPSNLEGARGRDNYVAARRVRQSTELGEHQFITATGTAMSITLTNLDAGTVYKYRTYAKMGEETVYGAEMTFTTKGIYKDDSTTDIENLVVTDSYPSPTEKAQKILRNGQILILLPDGRTYNLQGAEVRVN